MGGKQSEQSEPGRNGATEGARIDVPLDPSVRKGKRGPAPGNFRDDPNALSKQQREALMRRVLLAEYRMKGWHDNEELAHELGVDVSTIYRDLKALDEMFVERAAGAVAFHKGLDLMRIETAIRAIWGKVVKGNLFAIKTLEGLLTRKAKLMGLDAPTNISIDWSEEVQKVGMNPTTVFETFVRLYMEQTGVTMDDLNPLIEGEVLDPEGGS